MKIGNFASPTQVFIKSRCSLPTCLQETVLSVSRALFIAVLQTLLSGFKLSLAALLPHQQVFTNHKILYATLLFTLAGNAYANHGDMWPECPDVEIMGEATVEFTNISDETYVVVPEGETFTVTSDATVSGSCEIWAMENSVCTLAGGPYLPYVNSHLMWSFDGFEWRLRAVEDRGTLLTSTISKAFGPGIHPLYVKNLGAGTLCEVLDPSTVDKRATLYINRAPPKDTPCGDSEGGDTGGNPCNISNGRKIERELDYASANFGLDIERNYYSKLSRKDYGLGHGWMMASLKHLEMGTNMIRARRANGGSEAFIQNGATWVAGPDGSMSLAQDAGGYILTLDSGATESYDLTGRIVAEMIQGHQLTYTYNPTGYTIGNEFGDTLSITYDANGHIDTIDTPIGTYLYEIDANNNLTQVTYPDLSTRIYHYEDPTFIHYLTGITDERNIRYSTFEYNSNGYVSASYHAGDVERIDLTYNIFGNRTLTNSRGNVSTYTTGTIGNINGRRVVTSITGPACSTCATGNTSFNYDSTNGNLLSKNENGQITEWGEYSPTQQPGYMIEAKGTVDERRTDYIYDPRFPGRTTHIIELSIYAHPDKNLTFGGDANGNRTLVEAVGYKVTNHTYDSNGNRISTTISGYRPDGTPVTSTTSWQYTGPLQQLSQIDGPRTDVSDITIYNYYANDAVQGFNRGRLKQVKQGVGSPSEVIVRDNIQYTATGKVDTEQRPNSLSLDYDYYLGNDRLQALTETGAAQTRVTRWTYLATGEVHTITQADGTPEATTLTFTYGEARRLTRITDGLGNYIEYTLDTEGNREAEKTYDVDDALKRQLTQTFDAYSHLDQTFQANESSDSNFAPEGTLSQVTDGNSVITDYSYDALHRLTQVTQDLGGIDTTTANATTGYNYDVAGNLTSVVDPVNGSTTYVYDDLGNLINQTSPDTGMTIFGYDEAGDLTQKTDANGQVFSYSYDALNRLTWLDAPETDDDITYLYDTCTNGVGRLCTVSNGSSTVTYAYDAFGNILAHQTLIYTYDAANRIKTLTYPSGAVATYHYDVAGQMNQVDLTVDGTTTPLASNISYAPFGTMTGLNYGNEQSLAMNLDTAYRLTSQSIPGILDLGYTLYNANGNLNTRTDSFSSTSSFTYDALNRLDTGSGSFGGRDFDYDLNGNRTNLISDAVATAYDYTPNSNRVSTESGWIYTLDANGNTTNRLKVNGSGEGRSFGYTSHNRLASVTDHVLVTSGKGNNQTTTLEDTLVSTYTYNGLGQRTSKAVEGGDTTQFVYGLAGSLLAELDGTGAVQREYVYLNDQVLAVLDQTEEQGNPGGGETILDDGNPGTSSTGNWTPNTSNKANDNDYLLADGGSGSAYRWTPNLTAGTYDVYAWYVKQRTHSTAPYGIVHAGQTTNATLDQSVGGNAWYPIASGISFDGSGAEYVEVSDANGKTTADAVRFVNVGGSGGGTITKVYYVHNDHLGTPLAMTDETGTTVWRATHDPYGLAAVDEDPDGDSALSTLNVRFPGQYYDGESGLHYNYFRDYDPSTGRYVQSDPIGLAGGLNTYGYVGGNPLSYTDPLGLHYYQRNGSYVPHTHTYPSNGSDGGVDFSPKDKGMLEPFSIEHYNLPPCINCNEQFSSCLGGSASVDCGICSATANPLACTKCAISGAQALSCVAEHCKEGKKGQDGSCIDPKTCK